MFMQFETWKMNVFFRIHTAHFLPSIASFSVWEMMLNIQLARLIHDRWKLNWHLFGTENSYSNGSSRHQFSARFPNIHLVCNFYFCHSCAVDNYNFVHMSLNWLFNNAHTHRHTETSGSSKSLIVICLKLKHSTWRSLLCVWEWKPVLYACLKRKPVSWQVTAQQIYTFSYFGALPFSWCCFIFFLFLYLIFNFKVDKIFEEGNDGKGKLQVLLVLLFY